MPMRSTWSAHEMHRSLGAERTQGADAAHAASCRSGAPAGLRHARSRSSDRLACATTLATRFGAGVVLKGAGSVLAYPDAHLRHQRQRQSRAWRPRASGDVLAGIVGALLAQHIDPRTALRYAVCLHGAAADALVAGWRGPLGVTASELPDAARDARQRCGPRNARHLRPSLTANRGVATAVAQPACRQGSPAARRHRTRSQGISTVAPVVARDSSARCASRGILRAGRSAAASDSILPAAPARTARRPSRSVAARVAGIGEQRRPRHVQRALLRQQPRSNAATGPDALPKLTNRPRGCRQSSDAGNVSLPTES